MPNSMKKTRNDVGEREPAMTEYEKQRALRIKQNMERMKALDLPSMTSSLNREFCDKEMKGESKASRKATKDKDDDEDEYQPTSEDDDDEEEEEEDEEEEEENNKREKRKKVANSSKKTRVRTSKCPQRDEKVGNAEEIDEDLALQKVVALSLGGVAESSNSMGGSMHKQSGRFCERKKVEMGTSKGRGRKAKGNGRPKMSEDDVVSCFFLIDEVGKGNITLRDIKKAMVTHDFYWTDKEINDMICFFDSKGNGNLNLEDFQRIVERCGMIQHAEYD